MKIGAFKVVGNILGNHDDLTQKSEEEITNGGGKKFEHFKKVGDTRK